MNNNNFLIPANSKKSMLYLGLFNMTDLIIVGSGALATVILMLTISLQNSSLKTALIVIAPLVICSFLVVPLPNQHNVRTFIKNIYTYYTRRRTYYWKGWCMNYGEESSSK